MKRETQFTLFQSPIDLAHDYWARLLASDSIAIDATCGNGYDTATLAKILFSRGEMGTLYAVDIQSAAIEATKKRLEVECGSQIADKVRYQQGCHSSFPVEIKPASVSLIIYNLGYLPGGDKSLTTQRTTTLKSLSEAMQLIKPGGAISVTCYPGHAEGKEEENLILDFSAGLSQKEWSCCHHRWINRKASPSLLLLQLKKG